MDRYDSGQWTRRHLCFVAALGLLQAPVAYAEHELYRNTARETSLVFSVDAIGAWYRSGGAWFGESEAFLGTHIEQWADLGVEPTLAFETRAGRGNFFAALSGVYASTAGDDASGSTVGFDDTDSLTLEQAHLGWRAEDLFAALDGDTFSIAVGRLDYTIGTGLLVDDGGADGGERGGWYLGMRKAFAEAVVAKLDSERWLVEIFDLSNQPRVGDTRGSARGANFEYRVGAGTALASSYLKIETEEPGIASLDVYSARAHWSGQGGFELSAEYVDQGNSEIEAKGYYAELGYTFESRAWSPQLRFRHALFDGDDPDTPRDERFRELAYGSTDWTSWYQGEITGEYVLGLGNLESQLVRLTLTPSESVTFDAMYYRFTLDRPMSLGATADDWGDELNVTVEWAATDQVSVTGVLGLLRPGQAAEQIVGGGSDWTHVMLLVAYSW